MEFNYRTSTVPGNRLLGGHKQNLVSTRTQDKEAMIPQEIDPDLPVNVQESPVDVWVDSGLPWGQSHEYNSPGSHGMLASVVLKEVTIIPTIVWPQAKLQGGNTAPPISRKFD